jgi:tRNA pseudouridine55 synthase
MSAMDGYLLIDKPIGWTSFDVVAKVRSLARQHSGNKRIKVGHAGTLDPMATGLLIVLIGQATKQQAQFMKQDKTYEVEITLGSTSSTDDREGELTVVDANPRITRQELDEALDAHSGRTEQIPPQFSAIKINGKRAYQHARKGETVELKPRRVHVNLRGVEFDPPTVKFLADVSSGTYIRSLARDIGHTLGVGGYLSALARTRIGQFEVAQAISTDKLDKLSLKNVIQTIA